MSAIVCRIGLTPHPTRPDLRLGCLAVGDEAIAIVVVGNHYREGQRGLFIPDGAIVPEGLLREMWLWNDATGKGRLAGKRGDRVKAREIGGIHSDGLFYGADYFDADGTFHVGPSWNNGWSEGQDVGAELGIMLPPLK